MSALRELQMAFGDAVVHGGAVPEIRERGLEREARVAIYRNNYYANLTGALSATYPVVERLVGEDFFRQAAHQYIRRFPSTSGNLHDYGEAFGEFLGLLSAASGLPYLPDVAALEWAWHEVFHAAASEVQLNLTALQALPEARHGELRFEFNRASRVLGSDYPALRIWQVNQDGYAGDTAVDLAEGGSRVLVIQRALDVELHALGAGEHAWLQSLAIGRDLQSAYADATETDPAFDLAAALQRHIQLGTLVAWYLAGEHDDLTATETCHVHLH